MFPTPADDGRECADDGNESRQHNGLFAMAFVEMLRPGNMIAVIEGSPACRGSTYTAPRNFSFFA